MANEESREIYLFGEIGHEMACQFIAFLRGMDAACVNKPITIIINSVGGEMWSGAAIYDAITLTKSKVVGQVYGACMSAAAMVLQACDARYLSPTCRMMIHNPYEDGGEADIRKLKADLKEIEHVTDLYYEKMTSKADLSLAKIRKMCEDTTYLTARQAIQYGFADEILGE